MTGLRQADREALERLEVSLWQAETRFDRAYMERVLAEDFHEFGRSGRVYTREETLAVPDEGSIEIRLPLPDFRVQPISADVVLVTYVSEVTYEGVTEVGNRSSLWSRSEDGWRLRFHQGTAVPTAGGEEVAS